MSDEDVPATCPLTDAELNALADKLGIPEHDHRLALGIAYRRLGHSWRYCARMAGYSSHKELWVKVKKFALDPDLPPEEHLQRINQLAFKNTEEAMLITAEKLQDPEEKVSLMQAATVAGIMADKRFRGEQAIQSAGANDDMLGKLFGKLESGDSATLTVKKAEPVIDVTPEPDDAA